MSDYTTTIINNNNGGVVNVNFNESPEKEKPKSSTGGWGPVVHIGGIGCLAMIAAGAIEASVAFITPLLPTIAGIAATGAAGTIAVWQRRRIAPVIAKLTPKRPQIAAPTEGQQIEAPTKKRPQLEAFGNPEYLESVRSRENVTVIYPQE